MVNDELDQQNEQLNVSNTLQEKKTSVETNEGVLGGVPETNSPQNGESIITDWDESNDLDNPHNWPRWKKILHSAIPSIYGLALYVSPFGACTSLTDMTARLGRPHLSPRYHMLCSNSTSVGQWRFCP